MDVCTKLRCLDLFSGIGGISLGLKRAGIARTVCYCEIDPYAVGVLIKAMGAGDLDVAPVWDDVKTFGRSEIEAVGPIDLIAGGFPCQDISCIKWGEGIQEGNRSGLFYEVMRLVRLVGPKYVFLENVPALLVRGMDIVLSELSKAGYDARWEVVSASQVKAAHSRERVWILAHAQSVRCDEGGDIYDRCTQKAEYGRRLFSQHSNGVCDQIQPIPGTDFLREIDVVPDDLDRLRCLGNAVVPQCVEAIFER